MSILWLKALHIFFIIAWFAGIFYLPRLMVYNAESNEQSVKNQLNIMQRRLWFFVLPFAMLTAIFGLGLIHVYGIDWFKAAHWLHLKLVLVLLIYAYYFYLFLLVKKFEQGANTHSPRFYRILNESPVILLFIIVAMAIIKPSF